MNSSDLSRSSTAGQQRQGPKLYRAPSAEPVSPEKAKELLLRNADTSDPAVQQMLDRIEKILEKRAAQ